MWSYTNQEQDWVEGRGAAASGRMIGAGIVDLWFAFQRLLGIWEARVRERGYLLSMDDRELHDLRLTRAEAVDEANKPFWRA
jgi:uncharacterized protein YjiS (DUF1127 family)